MSFRDSRIDPYGFTNESSEDAIVESTFEALAKNGLVNVQNTVRSVGDQISKLSQNQPTQKTVSVMKSLLSESSSAISTVEGQFRQWKNAVCDDPSSMQRKLILPTLEASFIAEVQKFHQTRQAVELIEKNLDSDPFTLMHSIDGGMHHLPTSSLMIQFPSPTNTNELTDLPLDQFLTKEQQNATPAALGKQPGASPDRLSSGQQSPEFPAVTTLNRSNYQESLGGQRNSTAIAHLPLVAIGRNFYDHLDDDNDDESEASGVMIGTKKVISSSSTSTGGSGSPISQRGEGSRRSCPSTASSITSPDHRISRLPVSNVSHISATNTDDFLEDDYLYQTQRHHQNNNSFYNEDDDDEEEVSGLLSRGSIQSASYLDGWHLTVDKSGHDDDLELYVSRERLRGVNRIKAQLSQISHVFKELAHLINEQQEDFDLIDSNMLNIKNSTGSAVDELRRANILKQRSRRRTLFMILLTIVVGAIVIFVYFLQSSRTLPPSLALSPPTHALHSIPPNPLSLYMEPIDDVIVNEAQGRSVKDLKYSGLSGQLPK